jgi:SOS-response transcriptional repressor LexA
VSKAVDVAILFEAGYNISDKEMICVDKSLGQILTSLRKEAGYTQPNVSKLLASEGVYIKTAGISKWEKGLTQPNASQFLALCKIYGVNDVMGTFTDYVRPEDELTAEGRRLVSDYVRVLVASGLYTAIPRIEKPRRIPLYTLAASAGTGQFLDGEDFEMADVGGEVPESADFGVRIAGGSMEPMIRDGQIVWVRRTETLRSGQIGIFAYNGQAFCKKLSAGKDGVFLVSLNSRYKPIEVTTALELHVFGEVVI